ARVMRVLTANISLLFFFSSRRRHTRSKRDWSSDVCSSDLTLENPISLVIAILTIYGILYAFIQFAIGYANQKESDKYWGRSSMEKLLLQHVEFVIFHSNFFKFLLIYSVFFALLNWEEILFIEPYHDRS